MQPDPPHGRGAAANPPNRFELICHERDPDAPDEDGPGPATQFLRDSSRSILVSNDSPDVGFEVSINPYRGCEQGCVYCLSGDTPILMGDGSVRRLEQVRIGDEVYGTMRRGWYRRYMRTRVLAHWQVTKLAYRVRLRDGTCLVAGADHRFLTERGWKFVAGKGAGPGRRPHLTVNNKLMGVGQFVLPPEHDEDYKQGYLCGMVRGDGLLGFYAYERSGRTHGNQYHFRLALVDDDALERTARFLLEFGISTFRFRFQNASADAKRLDAIRTNAREHFQRIEALIAWPAAPTDPWCKGYLAGVFDAEGSYSDGVLRVSNTDSAIIACTSLCLQRFGFSFATEVATAGRNKPVTALRLTGGLQEHLRFFHTVDTAIARKRDLEGQAVKSEADLRVASVEPLGVTLPLFDITTGTGDFIANGVASHNCYARPTHEYLGFSAGLDFETKILVKEDAPELLRRELASPRWVPRPVAVCGVTDAYQPVERRLRLTRRCLEVLAEFRNPVSVITKSRLVTRDADLLAELARFNAAAVIVSITTLDAELARNMEPRATAPAGRLAAVEELARAGVPVGVFVAPVVPGLTDHELPAILQAAAAAGARYAGFVLLRLPHGVGDLFDDWLRRHYPDCREKVLGRLRQMRGGALNDPRFGWRMRGWGPLAEQVRALFALGCRRAGLSRDFPALSAAAFRRPGGTQRLLFE